MEEKILTKSDIIERLQSSEEQIKNGEVIEAETMFKEMREKYGY